MDAYTEMIQEQAKKYNSTIGRMDLANRAFCESDNYVCILLDVYVHHFNTEPMTKDEYLTFVANIKKEDFAEIIEGTHPIVQ